MDSEPYAIRFLASAARSFRDLPREVQQRCINSIRALAADPRPAGSGLTGFGNLHKIRQGDYRVVYQISDQDQMVSIIIAGHRREVYQDLRRLGYRR